MSLPPREAWIEIIIHAPTITAVPSLPPREAWIEIGNMPTFNFEVKGRFPRGKRGLKWKII